MRDLGVINAEVLDGLRSLTLLARQGWSNGRGAVLAPLVGRPVVGAVVVEQYVVAADLRTVAVKVVAVRVGRFPNPLVIGARLSGGCNDRCTGDRAPGSGGE